MKNIGKYRIDFHSHILPAMDDGADTARTGVQMIQQSQEQGICAIAATPHYYPWQESPKDFLRRRSESLASLKERLPLDHPQLLCGAEILYFDGLIAVADLEKLCLDGTNCLLIEMPYGRWTDRAVGDLLSLRSQDYAVMLAHADRYLRFGNAKVIRWLSQQGVLIQCNAAFFLGRFSRYRALSMLNRGEIHAIGSDCHDLAGRAPNCGAAYDLIRRKGGIRAEADLLHQGAAILGDDSRRRTGRMSSS